MGDCEVLSLSCRKQIGCTGFRFSPAGAHTYIHSAFFHDLLRNMIVMSQQQVCGHIEHICVCLVLNMPRTLRPISMSSSLGKYENIVTLYSSISKYALCFSIYLYYFPSFLCFSFLYLFISFVRIILCFTMLSFSLLKNFYFNNMDLRFQHHQFYARQKSIFLPYI